jgi:hypothetical protein
VAKINWNQTDDETFAAVVTGGLSSGCYFGRAGQIVLNA